MEEDTELKQPISEPNGFHSPEIRTSKPRPSGYTSLKDILQSPSSSSPTTVSSPPAAAAASSWHEIPIKNPLVKHAAMAYLQPMSNQTTSFGGGSKGLAARLADGCCDCFRGVSWLCDAVSRFARELFGCEQLSSDDDDEDEEDEDEDEEVDSEKLRPRVFS